MVLAVPDEPDGKRDGRARLVGGGVGVLRIAPADDEPRPLAKDSRSRDAPSADRRKASSFLALLLGLTLS